MTLEQFTAAWPVWVWATAIIFAAGGVWITMIFVLRELRYLRPIIEKIPSLEVRVDAAEGELLRVRVRVHDANNAAQKALLAVAAQGD